MPAGIDGPTSPASAREVIPGMVNLTVESSAFSSPCTAVRAAVALALTRVPATSAECHTTHPHVTPTRHRSPERQDARLDDAPHDSGLHAHRIRLRSPLRTAPVQKGGAIIVHPDPAPRSLSQKYHNFLLPPVRSPFPVYLTQISRGDDENAEPQKNSDSRRITPHAQSLIGRAYLHGISAISF